MIIQTGELLVEGQRIVATDEDGDRYGQIVEVDVFDTILTYRVEYDDGRESWERRTSIHAVEDFMKKGQRIRKSDGRFGFIAKVDEDDARYSYYVTLDDEFSYWVSADDITNVEEPTFKKGDKVTVDFNSFFESGKVYTVEGGDDTHMTFEETDMVAGSFHLTKVEPPLPPSTELKMTVAINGGENMKGISDKLTELEEQMEIASDMLFKAQTSTEELRNQIAESIIVESENECEDEPEDEPKAKNLSRKDVIQKAKDYIEELFDEDGEIVLSTGSSTKPEFIVNEEKHTVIALMRGVFSNKVRAKGQAKSSSNDVFNIHIGKAIALAKALGKDVPDEFINAPQPEEAEVGMGVQSKESGNVYQLTERVPEYDYSRYGKAFRTNGKAFGWLGSEQVNIINDSNTDYSKGGK